MTVTKKQEKKLVQDIGKLVQELPEAKREYILGFAEGMAFGAKRKEEKHDGKC